MQLPHGLFILPMMPWHCHCGACFCWSDGELMSYVSAKSLQERRKSSFLRLIAKWHYSKTQWRAWTHLNCITAAVGVVFQRSNKILPKGFFWSTNTSHLVSGSGNRVGDCADKVTLRWSHCWFYCFTCNLTDWKKGFIPCIHQNTIIFDMCL